MYCKLHDIKVDKIFIDKAVSGKSTDRPKYYEMINYIKENDRIHRSLYNLLAMIYELQEYEVALVSVTGMSDISTDVRYFFRV